MPKTYRHHPHHDLYWMAHDEHVQSGGIVGGIVRELASRGDYTAALAWLGTARYSDFRTRPFRGL